jgi:hypothetical protein
MTRFKASAPKTVREALDIELASIPAIKPGERLPDRRVHSGKSDRADDLRGYQREKLRDQSSLVEGFGIPHSSARMRPGSIRCTCENPLGPSCWWCLGGVSD